jgi:membrane-associated PAP2 superfamily phosphatase
MAGFYARGMRFRFAAARTVPAEAGLAGERRLAAPSLSRDVAFLALGLLAVIAWDAVGLDLPLSRLFGTPAGFALRDHWLTEGVLHSGARELAWVLAIVLVVGIWRPLPFARVLTRHERVAWVATTLACVILIPLLKQVSLTSCPWSLAEFGGSASYVSHWLVGHADGGPGRCFPAGHPTAAFCFLPGYFVLRRAAPAAARAWLLATLVAGIVLAGVQVVRGAHYLSHTLWTAWWCWALSLAMLHAMRARTSPRDTGP